MPSKPTSASVPKKMSQSTSPWPMSRCWWTVALRAGRVDDVAQARGGLVVEGVGDVDVGQHRRGLADHRLDIVAEVEGVRRAVEEAHVLRVDHPDHVDRRLQRLDEVLGMRLDVELDALLLEDRHQLLHRAEPGRLAGLGEGAGTAGAVARHVGRGPAAELRVHGVAAHLDRDLDRGLPVGDRGLPLALDRARPAVHRQQRGELDAGILERPLELLDPLRIDARPHPPVRKSARGESSIYS